MYAPRARDKNPEVVGIQRNEAPGGQLHLTIGNHSIQQGNRANTLSIVDNVGQIEVYLDDSDRPLNVETGRLSALVETYNEMETDPTALSDTKVLRTVFGGETVHSN